MKDTGPAMVKLHTSIFWGPLLFSLIFFSCAPAGQQPSDIDGDVTLHCSADQCSIDGTCVDSGVKNGSHDCLYCNPDLNPEGWSRYQSYDRHICRESLGECDPAETCNGTSDDCPQDKHTADGMPCGVQNICDGMYTCQEGSCAQTTSALKCPVRMYCDRETQSCICEENFTGEECQECAPGFYGETCKKCEDPAYVGEFCDICAEGYYHEPDSSICKPCPLCGDNQRRDCRGGDAPACVCMHGWDGINCDYCAHGFAGENCDECRRGYTGYNCNSCDYNFTGDDCDQCVEFHTGEDCMDCVPNRTGPYCVNCAAGFTGENCDQCARNFTGEHCDQCKAGFEGPNCMPTHNCVNGTLEASLCKCDEGWFGSRCDRNTLALPACVPGGGTCYRDIECCSDAHCEGATNGRPATCVAGGEQKLSKGTFRGFSPCGNFVVLEYRQTQEPDALAFLEVETLSAGHVINLPESPGSWDVNLAEDLLLVTRFGQMVTLKQFSTGEVLFNLGTSVKCYRISPMGQFLLPLMNEYSLEEDWVWYNMYTGEFQTLPAYENHIPSGPGGDPACMSRYYRDSDMIMSPDDSRFVFANLLMLESGTPRNDGSYDCDYFDYPEEATMQLSLADDLQWQCTSENWRQYTGMFYNRSGDLLAMTTDSGEEIILLNNDCSLHARYPGRSASFGPNGEIAILTNDGLISMYVPGENAPYTQYYVADRYHATNIALSPDGTLLAVQRSDGIAVFNAHNGQELVFRQWD